MNETLSKYGVLLVVLVLGVLVLVSRRMGGGGGAALVPDYNIVTTGIDTEYEALKFGAEVQKAAIGGQAYTDLLDYNTALAKLGTDERIAELEGRYAFNIAELGAGVQRYQADVAGRIAQTGSIAATRQRELETRAAETLAHEQGRAARHQSWAGAVSSIGNGLLSFFGF